MAFHIFKVCEFFILMRILFQSKFEFPKFFSRLSRQGFSSSTNCKYGNANFIHYADEHMFSLHAKNFFPLSLQ